MGPKKVDSSKKMTKRLTMTCNEAEMKMIIEAIKIAERRNVSDYMRSVVIPSAKNVVANQRLFNMTEMMINPDFFVQTGILGAKELLRQESGCADNMNEQDCKEYLTKEFEKIMPKNPNKK